MTKMVVRLLMGVGIVLMFGFQGGLEAKAASDQEGPHYVPTEEYAVYDRVMEAKFFTSQTKLVVIERMTTSKLTSEETHFSLRQFFQMNQFFNNSLPSSLVEGFLLKSVRPARLQSKFTFSIPVKFVTAQYLDDAEVSLSPMPVGLAPVQKRPGPLPVLGVFQLSRVAFTPSRDQALVFVGVNRPDGSGAGFLIWLYQHQDLWDLFGTEVLWVRQ